MSGGCPYVACLPCSRVSGLNRKGYGAVSGVVEEDNCPPLRRTAVTNAPLDDDACWTALRCRDRAADGSFVYSVRTTGVFCRPSCPSRAARRENVAFHASCADAARAGFRPCLRCRPDVAMGRHAASVLAACRTIEQAEETPTLHALAQAAGLSPWHFHRVFRDATGLAPRAYAAAHRARRVRDVVGRAATMTDAVFEAGFSSTGHFYAQSGRLLGMSPRARRCGGTGEVIRFAVGECSLGSVLVAATGQGVCAIQLGDDPERLVRELQDRFPRAELRGGEAGFERWTAQVVAMVEAPARGLDLPLDVRGTAFQHRVWTALNKIRPGETISYAELAARIGAPRAARAVAAACAANSVAVAIACHRVVRTDGSLSGYRWGVARKHVLLAREAAASAAFPPGADRPQASTTAAREGAPPATAGSPGGQCEC